MLHCIPSQNLSQAHKQAFLKFAAELVKGMSGLQLGDEALCVPYYGLSCPDLEIIQYIP